MRRPRAGPALVLYIKNFALASVRAFLHSSRYLCTFDLVVRSFELGYVDSGRAIEVVLSLIAVLSRADTGPFRFFRYLF